MNKTAIKNFAVWARKKLISDITYKAGMIGITENGIAEKLPQSTNDLYFFDIGTKNYTEISGKEISQRNALVAAIKQKERDVKSHKEAFQYVVEEVAYTWFNRLVAIRFMEINDYLPSGIRVLSSENKAKNEPDFVTSPFDTDLEFTPYEQDRVIQLKDENKLDELFRMLFSKQCNKLHDILPELFEKTDDYSELLLTISFTDNDGIIYHLVHDIPEDNFNLEKEGQVEIIGWLYQYYNTEPKDTVFANLKKNVKISKENIPAATQLFTPDWIVRYMVENSLGRLWLDGHSKSSVKSGWKYYLEEAEQEESVKAQLDEIRREYSTINPEQIKFIDPCMGSGHILVYAFDVLMQIYVSCGYTERDAAQLIIQKNLFGLDLDRRACQLSYFALMMKARQYDRRFLTRGIKPNLAHFQELGGINPGNLKGELSLFADQFNNADTYGSLLEVKPFDADKVEALVNGFEEDILTSGYGITLSKMLDAYKILSQKYDVVCTNPPYMGGSGMSAALSDFVKNNFADYKSDLFSASIVRCTQLAKPSGYLGFLSPYVWMFIQSYEKLRNYFYTSKTIETLIQFEYSAFEEATVPICTFVLKNSRVKKNGVYLRLTDFRGGMEVQRQKTLEAIDNHNCGFYYEANSENFSKIPGSPVAYWVSENFVRAFENEKYKFSLYANAKAGLSTTDNNRFLRYWYEPEITKIGFSFYSSIEQTTDCKYKFIPQPKGGNYRKWYGNNEYVVNWYNNGMEIRKAAEGASGGRIVGAEYYFKEGITWTDLTSGSISIRLLEKGCIFNSSAPSAFFNNIDNRFYIMGLYNSIVAAEYLKVLSPTFHFNAGPVEKVPVIMNDEYKQNVDNLVENNIQLSKTDWDSFETSWDFKKHPLVEKSKDLWDATAVGAAISKYYGKHIEVSCPLELCYMLWQGECNERFNRLKANEEELNRIFIDIYGLQDELTPEVEDKDVTVRKADLQRDIKSLISYAVGCMFGRYSLDVDGLAYAGGEWDESKYKSFIPDKDNCIPITDEEYFEDDIVGLLCAWLKKVYGEDALEQNLDFIAKALGNKGSTSREVIRNYFLNDFFKDHVKIYQKRPIYWLFDSGKQNGFKALVYMHRWNADTIGNMRVEYLHRIQHVYEKEIERMQEIIDNSRDNKEISKATKRKEKLQKQIKETKDYDAMVAHLALSRIDIDLDDGVKVNYEKVQTASDGKKMQILAKI